jgi:hypothetical protein
MAADKRDRVSVDISELRERIEAAKDDALWRETPITRKIRTLLIEKLDEIEQGKTSQ